MKYLPFVQKIVKIGPVDPEIELSLKKKKLLKVKCIALSASVPGKLN